VAPKKKGWTAMTKLVDMRCREAATRRDIRTSKAGQTRLSQKMTRQNWVDRLKVLSECAGRTRKLIDAAQAGNRDYGALD
jgi:hypothetical protein